MFENTCGIYKITCLSNLKIYIGSTSDIKIRWRNHRNSLRRNKHVNKYLQNAWNKYGEENFRFEVIEIISNQDFLNEREQFWLDNTKSFNGEVGFNILPFANSVRGYKHTNETKEKIRNRQKGRKMPEHLKEILKESHMGRKNSEETKRKMSESQRGTKSCKAILSEEDVINIKLRILRLDKIKDIADDYNIDARHVSSIKSGRIWSHILPELDLNSINLKKANRNKLFKDELKKELEYWIDKYSHIAQSAIQ